MLSGEIFAFWKKRQASIMWTALLIITSQHKQLGNRCDTLLKDILWTPLKIIEVFKTIGGMEATAQLPPAVLSKVYCAFEPLYIGASKWQVFWRLYECSSHGDSYVSLKSAHSRRGWGWMWCFFFFFFCNFKKCKLISLLKSNFRPGYPPPPKLWFYTP